MAQVIVKTGTEHYKTNVTTSTHELLADEPKPMGTDLGPNPYEFLLVALGTCVSMTLRMYADRKGWDMQEVEVHLDQQRIHARDCEDCESTDGYIHSIEKKLQFKGDLSQEQINRLLEIADKCPVQKTLLNEIKIQTSLVN